MPSSSTQLSPIGFGRCGDRVEKTPYLRFSGAYGGVTFGFQVAFRWKMKTTQTRSNPARSSSACSNPRPG